ncbi:MAG TPA: hypothetical protein VMX94_12125 [Armatimonadota bacterium]|nr:hypothetical protein [Armatimonadota bacterium]
MALVAGKDRTTAAYSRWGRGGVLALASSWSLSNEGIARDDNIVLVLNALRYRHPTGGMVTFSEYHHGYGRAPGIWSLFDTPTRLGIAQVGLAFLLLLFAVSRRFGAPVPLREGVRQRSEYLSSMASLLRRAHATDAARRELERKFREDIACALGLPSDADASSIVEAAGRTHSDQAERLRRLLADTSGGANEGELLALADRWYQMRKEIIGQHDSKRTR